MTTAQALDVVHPAAEIKTEVATLSGEFQTRLQESLELLKRIGISLKRDLNLARGNKLRFDRQRSIGRLTLRLSMAPMRSVTMPFDDAAQYYLDRCRAAVTMSQAAAEPAVRNIHIELARQYADLANMPHVTAEILPAKPVRARLTIAPRANRSGENYD
jgi:hypothetical protein